MVVRIQARSYGRSPIVRELFARLRRRQLPPDREVIIGVIGKPRLSEFRDGFAKTVSHAETPVLLFVIRYLRCSLRNFHIRITDEKADFITQKKETQLVRSSGVHADSRLEMPR